MWLRLTEADGNTVMVNSQHIVWFSAQGSGSMTELRCTYYGGDRNITINVKETVDEVAALLAGEGRTSVQGAGDLV